jgi:L-amino acid N-acyltransferase YncA
MSVDIESVAVEGMTASDWPAVAVIYRQGLDTGHASFETDVPSFSDWDRAHLAQPRLVGRIDNAVVGWAALSPVSDRCVYGGVAEDSVYVATGATGRGIGRTLLSELVRRDVLLVERRSGRIA